MDHTVAHALLVLAGVLLSQLAAYTTVRFAEWTTLRLDGEWPCRDDVASAAVFWPAVLAQLLCVWAVLLAVALAEALTGEEPPDDHGAGGGA